MQELTVVPFVFYLNKRLDPEHQVVGDLKEYDHHLLDHFSHWNKKSSVRLTGLFSFNRAYNVRKYSIDDDSTSYFVRGDKTEQQKVGIFYKVRPLPRSMEMAPRVIQTKSLIPIYLSKIRSCINWPLTLCSALPLHFKCPSLPKVDITLITAMCGKRAPEQLCAFCTILNNPAIRAHHWPEGTISKPHFFLLSLYAMCVV